MADIKDVKRHIENYDDEIVVATEPETLPLPASLAGLSKEELHKLAVKTTWKMDIVIMPCMTILYILNYLDRQNIAASKLANIMEDLDMSVTQFNTVVSILFVGYSEYSTTNDSTPRLTIYPQSSNASSV